MKRSFDNVLNLSENFDLNRPLIQMNGFDEMVISGENNILDYSDDELKICISDKTLTILGTGITINCIDKAFIVVKGKILSILFSR